MPPPVAEHKGPANATHLDKSTSQPNIVRRVSKTSSTGSPVIRSPLLSRKVHDQIYNQALGTKTKPTEGSKEQSKGSKGAPKTGTDPKPKDGAGVKSAPPGGPGTQNQWKVPLIPQRGAEAMQQSPGVPSTDGQTAGAGTVSSGVADEILRTMQTPPVRPETEFSGPDTFVHRLATSPSSASGTPFQSYLPPPIPFDDGSSPQSRGEVSHLWML